MKQQEIDLTIRGISPEQAQAVARLLQGESVNAEEDDDTDTDEEEETPKKAGKVKGTKKAAAEDEDDDTDTDEDEDGPTLADVMKACKDFTKSNKGDKKPTIQILKKLGVKSVQDLDEEDYPKAMKLFDV